MLIIGALKLLYVLGQSEEKERKKRSILQNDYLMHFNRLRRTCVLFSLFSALSLISWGLSERGSWLWSFNKKHTSRFESKKTTKKIKNQKSNQRQRQQQIVTNIHIQRFLVQLKRIEQQPATTGNNSLSSWNWIVGNFNIVSFDSRCFLLMLFLNELQLTQIALHPKHWPTRTVLKSKFKRKCKTKIIFFKPITLNTLPMW